MMSKLVLFPLLCAALLLPALALACRGSDGPESVPVSLPTALPTETARPLSASELMQLDEFATQQQAIAQDWDQFHRDFDAWRNGLMSCTRDSFEKALQGFALGFSDVTAQARALPRADDDTRAFADMLIDAAEAEEASYRRLRDQWQPGALPLFESIELFRADSTFAQRIVEDQTEDLRQELEDAADPEELANVEEISLALTSVTADWRQFHRDFDILMQVADDLNDASFLSRLNGLINSFASLLGDINALSASDALGDRIEALRLAAHSESSALQSLHDAASVGSPLNPESGPPPIPGTIQAPQRPIGAHIEAMNNAIAGAESSLTEANGSVRDIIDGSASERLVEVRNFLIAYTTLKSGWDDFHQDYNRWRSMDGGCDEGAVIEKLAQFKSQISEIGRRVRDLPQSGYLLPAYSLLVEATDIEEGSIRALQNSWRPYTVDAFIAVDRERGNSQGLRREANTAVQELRSRATAQ